MWVAGGILLGAYVFIFSEVIHRTYAAIVAIGVGLGGNGTHLGATANIICVAEAERSGLPDARITPAAWLRTGLPVVVAGLLLASATFIAIYSHLL